MSPKIHHLAIWVADPEGMKTFYTRYFDAVAGELYENPEKQFSSYFLYFDDGCRIELMHHPEITLPTQRDLYRQGLAHFAISVGSRKRVDQLTAQLQDDGYTVAGKPRLTGDGYYESIILDPEGNRIEITT